MNAETTLQVAGPAKLGNPTISRIIRAYGRMTAISVEDLEGPSQAATISHHRHRLMYLIRQIDPVASYSLIGRYLGGRDMATVHEAIVKIARAAATSLDLARALETDQALLRRAIRNEVDVPGPWQLIAAIHLLGDEALTDAEARKAALGFLQQLEVTHG
jgi:hypothetical protein